jgi:hypothetical protein
LEREDCILEEEPEFGCPYYELEASNGTTVGDIVCCSEYLEEP